MHSTLRFFIWMALVVGGIAAVLLTLIFETDAMGVIVGAGALLCWVIWGIISSWLFGIRRLVVAHMGKPMDSLTYVSKDIGSSRVADFIRTFEALRKNQVSQWHGISRDRNLAELKVRNLDREGIDWQTVEGEEDQLINIPSNAIYFFTHQGKPFVARVSPTGQTNHFHHEDAWTTGAGELLELFSSSLDDANEIIRWLSSTTNQHSIYRGQLIQVATPQDGSTGQTIRIGQRPSVDREAIVLEDSVLKLIDRILNLRNRFAEELTRFGHKNKLGLLLHGPPGTGKTLLTRYLIGVQCEHTVIVPSDMEVQTLRESFRLAKYLQPSMLVIEDVDLLAPRRESGSRVDGLQELMNELDGLESADDTLVIMSTNRPEMLEPALAARPGRISQAIEVPLPNDLLRQQLLRLYLNEATTGQTLISEWSNRTEGASPAFLEELCKRAILLASERCEDDQIDVIHSDMEQAIHELVVMGGCLTAKALGFPELIETIES